ncbi:MAG: extracellular solute-binding protein [Lachnospiraceae bacterium]|nr:extracellular solute-binding protein [Lachnospiraceae bacterium]
MGFKRKLISVLALIAIVAGSVYIGNQHNRRLEEMRNNPYDATETVYFWYSDAGLTDFFVNAAVAFHEKYAGIRVVPVLVDSKDYLENINEASIKGEKFPDIYLLSNESLEKAYLAGLASEVTDPGSAMADGRFSKGALDAVTYKDKYVGYPLAFETSVLLYNKTLLQNWADRINAGEKASAGEGLSASEMEDFEEEEGDLPAETTEEAPETEEEVKEVSYLDYVPQTVQDILDFADAYEPEEGVENVFKWDVSDIFYNYFFVGNYMIVGGDSGDDQGNINIYNSDALKCMQVYQGLNQFFSIDAADSSAEKVLNDFIAGKTVYTIATSNAIAKIDAALAEANEEYKNKIKEAKAHNLEILDEKTGEESEDELIDLDSIEKPMEIGYELVPDVSKDYKSRSMSVTEAVIVNGYSENKTAANRFAAFVTSSYSKNLYSKSGKLAACMDAGYTEDSCITFQKEYARSIPLPKIVESSNFWVQLEITFQEVWEGEEADVLLSNLESQIKTQLGN